MEQGLEQIVGTAAAGGLGGFQLVDFGHPLGELLLQGERRDEDFELTNLGKIQCFLCDAPNALIGLRSQRRRVQLDC